MEGLIEVYQDWSAGEQPKRLGILRVRHGRTNELFDFTFDDDVLTDTVLAKQMLDPDLGICFQGRSSPKTDARCSASFRTPVPIDGERC